MKNPLEVRLTSSTGLAADSAPRANDRTGPTLKGYAAVFNTLSENLGGFFERIDRGAFSASLVIERRDVLALFNHERSFLLGRTRSGTLKLFEDAHGLAFTLRLPKTQLGEDVAELVSRGDVSQMSFRFIVPDGGDSWVRERGQTIRLLRRVELYEISLVPEPAYPTTSVTLREAVEAALRAALAARRHRLAALLS
jgi:HK97 family phage prohead protease